MQLKVLQWNIWIKENPDNVVKLLKELDADVVCLQELSQNFEKIDFVDVPELLNTKFEYHSKYYIAHSWDTPNGKMTQGNMILSKFPIIETDEYQVKKHTTHSDNKYGNEGRVLAIAKLDVNGRPINVATTHLSYSHKDEFAEQEQQEEDALIKKLKTIKGELIFTGDLNADENSRLVKRIEEFMVNSGPDYSQKTWTTKPFKYMDYDISELKHRLDFVFTTKGLEVKASEIISTEYSDHLPILVSFSI